MHDDHLEREASDFVDRITALLRASLDDDPDQPYYYNLPHWLNVANQLIEQFNFSNNTAGPSSVLQGKSVLHTLSSILSCALSHPEALASQYRYFVTDALKVLRQESDELPDKQDRRFRDPLWQDSPLLRSVLQLYLVWVKHMQSWLDRQAFSDLDRKRVQFLFDQAFASLAPSNFPFNPSALKKAESSQGKSAVFGLLNWAKDAATNHGMPRQVNPDAYTLGKDLAATPGKVVFRNACLELIQYAPQTPTVHRRPVLLIPPQINKYYIFDLKNKNSVLGYLVKQGLQMFVVSWRNPTKQHAHWGLDFYIKALIKAIKAVNSICRTRKLSLISACAGGLTTQSLLGYLAHTRQPLVQSHSLLVTALTAGNGSMLELFTTEESLRLATHYSKIEGVMDGRALAHVFAWLRPNDLVWKYWVNNYLLGNEPPPLDVLYWDNDPTQLPAKLHADFINIYQQQVFINPNRQVILGIPIDYRRLKINTYLAAGSEDYLMPWPGVYKYTQIFRGKHRFVLSDSGHVQSMLRPPSLARTEYLVNSDLPADSQQWYEQATIRKGTWWHDWMIWLKSQSGSLKSAPLKQGNNTYPVLINAPGRYVKQRS